MTQRTRRTDGLDKMSEADRIEFRRQLHNNKLAILITDLQRIKRSIAHIFEFEHADSKLIDDIIKDMEEAKLQ